MAVWSGLGVNYKSLAKVDQDIAFFNSIGLHYIRMHVPYAPVPWQSASLASWRNTAKQFHDAGFHVMWGFSSLGIGVSHTSTNWPGYAASVVDEAEYCEANDVCDLFIIGNELESLNDNTTLTDAQVRSNLRTLDTEVKAVTSIPTIYCAEYGSVGAGFGTHAWTVDGKGTIDIFGANLYGTYTAATNNYFPRYSHGNGAIPLLNSTFGDEWLVSEFNVDGVSANFEAMPDNRQEQELATYLKYMKDQNVPTAYLYQYRAFTDIDGSDSFFLVRSDDTLKRGFLPLVNNNGRKLYEAD